MSCVRYSFFSSEHVETVVTPEWMEGRMSAAFLRETSSPTVFDCCQYSAVQSARIAGEGPFIAAAERSSD